MENTKKEFVSYEIKNYQGSLDFPCDFCNTNSYDNLHINKAGNLLMVVCKDCIDKEMKEN